MYKLKRILLGMEIIWHKKRKAIFPIIYLILMCIIWDAGKNYISSFKIRLLTKLCEVGFMLFLIVITVGGLEIILMLLGTPFKARKIEKSLAKIKIVDHTGCTPILVSNTRKDTIVTYEFYSSTIPQSTYMNYQGELETVLNMQIISIVQGKDKQHVLVECVSAKNKLPNIITWNETDLSKKEFELLIGVSQFGRESIDINTTPHVLIGGGTGSGKSKLLKLLLIQCIKKGSTVKIFDFKSGIDFPKVWHEKCSIITTPEEMNKQLSNMLEIMEKRRRLLVEKGKPNIYEYNKISTTKINRFIVACDEVAEVLDKTGLDKEQKVLISQIESKISTIARQGRAFGIHLILATQRPDADILKGQIKNNIGYRICGRADKVLSQIILDNSEGANQISQNDTGIFLTNTKVLFKAYYVSDNCLE